ncbi:nitroreductase family protein [bacterium]|nr:nitroreductase family protein [bacterium]
MNFEDFEWLVLKTRSVRRFRSYRPVTIDTLHRLVDLARQASSGMNRQPIKYILINESTACEKMFANVAWAAALKEWGGPSESERPKAYIILLGDTSISESFGCDQGIALKTIMLGARAMGFGCCPLGSVRADEVREIFDIDQRFEILLAMAFGASGEDIKIEPMPDDGNFNYWRDSQGNHHVPKRSLEEVIVKELTD